MRLLIHDDSIHTRELDNKILKKKKKKKNFDNPAIDCCRISLSIISFFRGFISIFILRYKFSTHEVPLARFVVFLSSKMWSDYVGFEKFNHY
jgi:hypothetical protein